MSEGPTFHNEQSGDNAVNKQAMTIVEGDNADSIDKSQHQGETNITGDGDVKIDNQNTIANNGNVTIEKAMKDLLAEAACLAEPLPVDKATAENEEFNEADVEGFKPVPIDDFAEDLSDHPENVMATMNTYAAMQPAEIEALPEEEKATFMQRFNSCMKKVAPVAKKGFFGSCNVALKVLGAVSGPAWPYNAIIGGLQGIVEQFGGEE